MTKLNLGIRSCGVALLWAVTAAIALPAQTLKTLHSFEETDGEHPLGGLVPATNGDFYGTTVGGGANNDGTVFKITPGGKLTTLHSFAGGDGVSPVAGLVQATDGKFYGTTGAGGVNGYGTVFKITPSGTLTTLYSFCAETNCTDGTSPWGGLIQATDGNFYGTTQEGGAATPAIRPMAVARSSR
jgi:uncharacterized repeat protein (TIGR03803 family)